MKIVYHTGADNNTYVRFEGDNHEAWFISEGYSTKSNAKRSVRNFFRHLGTIAYIEEGVLGFNVDIVDETHNEFAAEEKEVVMLENLAAEDLPKELDDQ